MKIKSKSKSNNKKQMKLLICATLTALLLLSVLTACSGTPAENNGDIEPGGSVLGDTSQLTGPDNTLDLHTDSGGDNGNEPGTTVEIAPPVAILPLNMDTDLGIEVGGTWYPIWQDASGLIASLGDDYELYAAPSCVFDVGDDKEFAYDGIYLYTNPYNGKDYWYLIYLESDALSTSRGIKTGNALDDVYAAYGDGYYWEGDTILVYSISGVQGDIASPNIQFHVADETVTAIEIYYPTNTT